jgi:hypothetical protein
LTTLTRIEGHVEIEVARKQLGQRAVEERDHLGAPDHAHHCCAAVRSVGEHGHASRVGPVLLARIGLGQAEAHQRLDVLRCAHGLAVVADLVDGQDPASEAAVAVAEPCVLDVHGHLVVDQSRPARA